MVIVGAPLFIVLFLIQYLNGVPIYIGAKVLIEVMIIICSYMELHSIEQSSKELNDRQGVLSKLLPYAKSNYGSFAQYYATVCKSQEITDELGL